MQYYIYNNKIIHKTDTEEEKKRRKEKGGDFMKKKLYYVLGDMCYHLRLYSACEYWFFKADAIAEAEFNREVTEFYEG